jgi:hypothetical protein
MMSEWIKENAFILRALVFVVFAVWIGGPVCFHIFKSLPDLSVRQDEWDGRLESLDREKVEKLKADINEMNRQAERKGMAYGAKSWLNDFARMHELATEYGISHYALTENASMQLLGIEELFDKSINNMAVHGKAPESESDCYEARVRLAIARGEPMPPQEKTNAELWAEIWPHLLKVGWFLLKLYLQMMLFCFFWFLLRLAGPRDWGWCSKDTTIRDELLLAPGRFVRAVVFWPVWFKVYGKFTDPAKALRYARLKVEYLRQKSGLEQLTPQEEQRLREQAEKPFEEFARAMAVLKEQRTLVKRSLAAATFWFLLGVFLSPFVSPRGKVFQTAGFCSGLVYALAVDKVVEKGAKSLPLVPRSPPMPEFEAICEWPELSELVGESFGVLPEKLFKPPDKIVLAIDHVPRRSSVSQYQLKMGAC